MAPLICRLNNKYNQQFTYHFSVISVTLFFMFKLLFSIFHSDIYIYIHIVCIIVKPIKRILEWKSRLFWTLLSKVFEFTCKHIRNIKTFHQTEIWQHILNSYQSKVIQNEKISRFNRWEVVTIPNNKEMFQSAMSLSVLVNLNLIYQHLTRG